MKIKLSRTYFSQKNSQQTDNISSNNSVMNNTRTVSSKTMFIVVIILILSSLFLSGCATTTLLNFIETADESETSTPITASDLETYSKIVLVPVAIVVDGVMIVVFIVAYPFIAPLGAI